MFVSTNRIRLTRGAGPELEESFSRRAGLEGQPGFLRFELWKLDRQEEHDEYLVVTHWESESAHAAWTGSEAFKQAHAGPRPDFLLGPGEIKAYQVRLVSAPEGVMRPS